MLARGKSFQGRHDIQHIYTQNYDTQHNDTQHNNKSTLSKMTHCKVLVLQCYVIYADCRVPEVSYISSVLNVIMLNVIMLNVIMLNVIMLNVIMLNVIMLNVIRLNVIMLNVVAPFQASQDQFLSCWCSTTTLSIMTFSITN